MKLVFLVLLAISLLGCNAITAANQSPFIDVQLIGLWKGEHTEQSGTIKSWTQIRNADGTYTIEFSFKEPDDTTKSFTESGRWWIQDALFYEIALPDMAHLININILSKRKIVSVLYSLKVMAQLKESMRIHLENV